MSASHSADRAPANAASSVRIDRIVVDGLPLGPGRERGFRLALEQELARTFAGGEPLAGGAVPSCRAAPIRLGARWQSSDLAREVAARVRDALREGR
jgi:hypothetical protein